MIFYYWGGVFSKNIAHVLSLIYVQEAYNTTKLLMNYPVSMATIMLFVGLCSVSISPQREFIYTEIYNTV